MTPATIIRHATADGVNLALSPTGTIKATGKQSAVKHWLPLIREHKPGIVKVLIGASVCSGNLYAIRAWLTFIGENDPAIIAETLAKCQNDAGALKFFGERSKDSFDREWFEERAGILEYDAGFPRPEAERLALLEVTKWAN